MTTEVMLSPTAHLEPAKLLRADAEGGSRRSGILHGAGEQRPHEESVSERGPALCGPVP